MSSFTSDGETKAGTDGDSGDVACTSSTSSTSSTFYKEQFICHTCNQTIFDTSVQAMMEGIAKNAYNHHKGDPSTRPPCLHPRVQSYDLGQCAECKVRLDQERFNKEKQLAEKVIKEDIAFAEGGGSQIISDQVVSDTSDHVKQRAKTRASNGTIVYSPTKIKQAKKIHSLGIRVEALIAFASAHDCTEWPTWRVVRDIIVPATRNRGRCRFGDLPELKECFGPATVFMSHCWGALFGDLVGAACHGARKDRIVWIDLCCEAVAW